MADIETWKTATFEEKYKSMMGGMSEADQKRSVKEIIHLCQCSKCPTCTGSVESNLVFCILGKNKVIQDQKGCLCSTCSITRTMSLRWD